MMRESVQRKRTLGRPSQAEIREYSANTPGAHDPEPRGIRLGCSSPCPKLVRNLHSLISDGVPTNRMTAPPPLIPLLPTDVQYLVIDSLTDDRESLRTCSLVCSNWLPVARAHLFRTINIVTADVQSPDNTRVHDFLYFVQHRPEFGPLIHHLVLGKAYDLTVVDVELLRAAIRAMPNLRSMHSKVKLVFSRIPASSQPPPAPIDELGFANSINFDLCGLLATTCMFANIGTLHINEIFLHPGSSPALASSFHPHIPSIRSLRLDSLKEEEVIDIIHDAIRQSPSHGQYLTSLACRAPLCQVSALSSFLCDIGAYLRQLTLIAVFDDFSFDVARIGEY